MSFKNFIYYCALCGGWAAFIAWAIQQFIGMQKPYFRDEHTLLQATVIGTILGLLLAFTVGLLDAILNSTSFSRYVRVMVCVVVGFIGSMFFSFLGQGLFEKMGSNKIFLVLGWALVGAVIGVSIGAFDLLRAFTGGGMKQAIRKIINGVIGGGIGGAIGGGLNAAMAILPWIPTEPSIDNNFNPPKDFKTALPMFFLATGMVILGMCIGLLIGLAQVLLKEAWVRVEQGFRAGREMILSKPDTTVGRAESCDIGLFGDPKVEKMHARIVLRGDRYMLVDVNTPDGTYLNGERIHGPTPLSSGDTIGVGKNVLRFEERAKRR